MAIPKPWRRTHRRMEIDVHSLTGIEHPWRGDRDSKLRPLLITGHQVDIVVGILIDAAPLVWQQRWRRRPPAAPIEILLTKLLVLSLQPEESSA